MAGVAVDEAYVGLDGILGDRQYAFVRSEHAARSSFPWLTARESARMLLYKPEFEELPNLQQPEPALRVQSPEGTRHNVNDPGLCAELSRDVAQPVWLLRNMRGMFDCQHVSLFSLSTVAGLSAEADGAIDRRQFRANVYFEPGSGQPFEEENWTDCLLRIGQQVLLAVTQRDSRCMMINLDPGTVAQDSRVLRSVARNHQGQAGLYANVVRPGLIRCGDPILKLPAP